MSEFSIYWKVANVDHIKDFSTRRNIKKPVLFPRYKGRVSDYDTVLAYVGSKEIDPLSNLEILHLESSVNENSLSVFSQQMIWIGSNGYTAAKNFLLTDVVADYRSRESEPLYRKHVLPEPSIDPFSVTIMDSNLEEVDENSYIVLRTEARDATDTIIPSKYESCCVFSNYKNQYNKESGELNLYYVRYTVQGTSHYQLLNSIPAFSAADFDDISSVTGLLKPWRKVYISSPSSIAYNITTPTTTGKYFLTPLESSRIYVKDPVDKSDNLPWFLNVSNGGFSTYRNSQSFYYTIKEFNSQDFSPLYPYKIEVNELGEYLRPDIIKVKRTPLKIDTSLYKMEILIKDVNENVLYALTTDVSKHGTYYKEFGKTIIRTIETDNNWVTWDSYSIAGWDVYGGFIQLIKDYPDTYQFFVTYYYTETGFEVTKMNINPIFDTTYNESFFSLYVIPEGGDNPSGSTCSLHYVKVDRSDRIIETSQDGSEGNIDLDSNIHIDSQYMYYSKSASSLTDGWNNIGQNYLDLVDASDFPSSGIVIFTDVLSNTYYIAYNRKEANRLYFETYTLSVANVAPSLAILHSFITPYTTTTNNDYQWLVLAESYLTTRYRVDELSIIDLRMPGGVIKEKYHDSAMAIDARSIWARPEVITSRGQAIPGDSVTVVKIPYTILKDYGGQFTREQVQEIVTHRHLATGVIPVIIYHGGIPNITSLTATYNSITVCWDSEGVDYSYNVYYKTYQNADWILANESPISDQVYGNCYTINGLNSGYTYYVSVTSVNIDNVESPRGTYWGIKVRN